MVVVDVTRGAAARGKATVLSIHDALSAALLFCDGFTDMNTTVDGCCNFLLVRRNRRDGCFSCGCDNNAKVPNF